MHERTDRARVVLALIAVQVFFGVHYLAAKILLEEIPPRAWAVIRVAGAAALLVAAARFWGRALPSDRRDLGRLALWSIFGVVVNQICFVEGLSRTTATHSAIINTLIPVATLLFAVLLGRESLTIAKGVSLALAIAGVLLVIRPGRAAFSSATYVGDLLTLVNAVSYSFFLVVSKRVLARTDPVGATAALLAFGSIGILALGVGPLWRFDLSSVQPTTWALGAFIIVFPTAGAYFLIYWALARAESSLVAIFIYLQPVIAGVLAAVLLGERASAATLAGAALIFVAVWIALRPARVSSAGRVA